METEIKITAHIDATGTNCRFVVDQPLYAAGSAFFSNKEKAQNAPLPKSLFELDFVSAVKVSCNELSVTASGRADWRVEARKIADIIRAQIRSGVPAVPTGYKSQTMPDNELRRVVQEIFDMEINPAIESHGGFINLADVKNGNLYIKLGGGCQGCASANATLRQGIEVTLRERVPDIQDIVDVTDHASGANPFFASTAG